MRAIGVLSAALSLAFPCALGAQGSEAICQLSEKQAQKAIQAFDDLSPIFTEPRCFNCHGGVSPFGKGRNHPDVGLKVIFKVIKDNVGDEDVGKTFEPCQECHGEFPGWRLAPAIPPAPNMQFSNKTTVELCMQMKRQFKFTGASKFVAHMTNDDGGTPFLDVAFTGTMGLNEEGQSVADGDNVKLPAPVPRMSRGQMLQHSREWVDAMDGEFHEPEECGCKEMQYALRARFKGVWAPPPSMGVNMRFEFGQKGSDAELPVIPIHFHDDGSLSGEGRLNGAGLGAISAPQIGCNAAGTQLIRVIASGSWRDARPTNLQKASSARSGGDKIQVKLDVSELAAQGDGSCEALGHIFSGNSRNKSDTVYPFNFSLDPIVDVTQIVPWNTPLPGWTGNAQVTLIRIK